MQLQRRGALCGAAFWQTRGPMSDAIALRNRFAMVKGAWDEHLRGVPFPALGEGTAEEKIERLELALVDKMRERATPETAEMAADGDVGPRPRPPGRRPGQAARHRSTTRAWPAWATAGSLSERLSRPTSASATPARTSRSSAPARGSEFCLCLRSKTEPGATRSTRGCP